VRAHHSHLGQKGASIVEVLVYVVITVTALIVFPKAMVGIVNSLSAATYERSASIDRQVEEMVQGKSPRRNPKVK
jgi:hypothetical protein